MSNLGYSAALAVSESDPGDSDRLSIGPGRVRPCQMSRTVFSETPNFGLIVLDDRKRPRVELLFLGRRAKLEICAAVSASRLS
jgi:hypothetical protein